MKKEISDDELIDILNKIELSDDLTIASNKSIEEIAELVYMKFQHEFDEYDFQSNIDDLAVEVNEEITDIKSIYGGEPYDVNKLKSELSSNKELHHHFQNVSIAIKLLNEINNDFELDDENLEFTSKVANLIPYIINIRARKDIVPLITRGIYAEDLKLALEFWQDHKYDDEGKEENIWQVELKQRKGILERVLGGKIVLLKEQAHVGTIEVNGKGDRITDYLFKHNDTRDISLVEIKTPNTTILGSIYRGTYPLSNAMSGTISQVLLQRNEIIKNFYQKSHSAEEKFEVYAPRCFIIIGSIENEIVGDDGKLKAFEFQRQAIASAITIITFDELYDQFSRFNVID